MTFTLIFQKWSNEDRENLKRILDATDSTPSGLEDRIWSVYNGSFRPAIKVGGKAAFTFIASKISKDNYEAPRARETWKEPNYDKLLEEACRELKAYESGASAPDHEVYLVQKLLANAIYNLPPKQRRELLEKEFDLESIAEKSGIKNSKLKGHAATLTALSAAQASGFGVYLLSTTLLGMVTSAIGITLPFAIYTGLTSAISIIIGPVGWTALGFSAIWKLTGPNWKKLLPAILYIITVRSRPG